MKREKIIIILSIVLIIGIILFGVIKFVMSRGSRTPNLSGLKVIAEKSNINYAWGFYYKGSAILSDGSIVEWDISDNDKKFYADSLEEVSDYILKNSTLTYKKVSSNDLELIIQYTKQVDNNFSKKSSGMNDAGASSIKVYDYDKKSQITLNQTGDWIIENETDTAQKLIKLIDKYL